MADDWEGWEVPNVTAAMRALRTDDRIRERWPHGLPQPLLCRIAGELEQATNRGVWEGKTQRERNEWLARFEKAKGALLELMQEAPTTPEQWGFPARDVVLMNVAHRFGLAVPENDQGSAFFSRMLELEAAADAECWTLADALRHYGEQVKGDCRAKQTLKKPRDAKAGRAEFIVRLRAYTDLTATEVATIAAVAFDDEFIDDRLVRRLTSGRADSCNS